MMSHRSLFGLMLVLLATVGCKAHEYGTRAQRRAAKEQAAALERIHQAAYTYTRLEVRGKAELTMEGQEVGFTYRLRMTRGESIWLTAQKFGLEGIRLLATPDSVWVLNRMARQAFVLDYPCLSQRLGMPVSFSTLEALLLGNFPLPDSLVRGYSPGPPTTFVFENHLTKGQIFIHKDEDRPEKIIAGLLSGDQQSTVTYGHYQDAGLSQLPFSLNLQVTGRYILEANLEHKKVSYDPEELRLSFSVPDEYKKINPC
ncbi:MAG: DUF4292 domain-containing protein [Bacteroidetes bacterium]|jgi:hypothetical protein|nr:DUF4292 domain-containing protein [Bacteroidota bacterium]